MTTPRTLLLALALAACADFPNGPAADELEVAYRRWQDAGLVDYRFDVQVLCFCIPDVTRPVTVTVAGGAPISLVYADSGTAADTVMFADVRTMERLFASLRRDLDQEPYEFRASYHDSVGYPLDVWIDFNAGTADEEIGYRVTNFSPLLRATGPGESFRGR